MEDFENTIEETEKIKLRVPKKDRNYKSMLEYAKQKGIKVNNLSRSELEFFGYIDSNEKQLSN